MRTQRRKEGYLLIDHSASPGTARVREGATLEAATYTCSHCQRVVVLNPARTRERAYCPKCDHHICDGCEAVRVASGGDCLTFKQRLDLAQQRIEQGLSIGDLKP